MSNIDVKKLDGGIASIDSNALMGLKSSLRGSVILPGDDGYDQSRTIWNAMLDRRPAVVIRCAGVSDIQRAVLFAREHGLLTAIKGGGHNIAGNAVCNDGLLIDLSGMRSVRIDPKSKIAHVEPGATLGDFDHEAQAFGLATPTGINSTTGIAGLTLGGGFGWLSRKLGMTVDNLLAMDVVLANGKLVRASKKENPDLFWALRGGSGNFGIVTRFEFKLHQIGPEVLTGLVVYALKDAPAALKQYNKYVKKLGSDTSVWVVLRKAPPLPFLPPEVHGKEVIVFAAFHAGNIAKGKKAIEPIRKFGKVLGEFIGVQPYKNWQGAFDPLLAPGARNYWKSHNFTEISDGAIDVTIKYIERLPSSQCEIFFGLIGAATTKVSKNAMAYAHRDAIWVCNVHGRWENAADDKKCIDWARGFFKDAAQFASSGVYVNFLTEEETDRVAAAYGPGYKKLVKAKKKYDPQNLFRMNQNISPVK